MLWLIDLIKIPFLTWGQYVFLGLAVLVLGFVYFSKRFKGKKRKNIFLYTAGGVLGFKVLYAAVASWSQYDIWSDNGFSQFLLPPYQSIEYFFVYSWSHYWLEVIVSAVLSLVFYLFLKSLKKYKSRFFKPGEVELGLACSLVAGWPGFLVFTPLSFSFVVLHSILNQLIKEKVYTTIGASLMLSAVLTFLVESYLIDLLNLGVFNP